MREVRDRTLAQRRRRAACCGNARALVNLSALKGRGGHMTTFRPVVPTV